MQDSSKPASPSDFVWYHSEGDDTPMGPHSPSKTRESSGQNTGSGTSPTAYYPFSAIIDLLTIGLKCIQRSGRGGKMAEALAHEKADEHGNPIKRFTTLTVGPPRKSRQAKKQRIDTAEAVASSDEDDHDYQDTEPVESESTSPSEPDCQDAIPSNAEAIFILCLIVLFLCMRQSICRSQISYHPRRSPLVDGVLLESACGQSQRRRLRSNLSVALRACAAITNHAKQCRNQWCV